MLADALVRELLGLRLVAVLATIAEDGVPHLTPVWFADGGDCILMATGSTSRKVANVRRDPRAGLVLHDSRPGFEVCGASITGTVAVVAGAEATPLVDTVHGRYVDPASWALPAVHAFLASDDVALRFVPDVAWTWDQRETGASRQLRQEGGAFALAPTAPRGSAEP